MGIWSRLLRKHTKELKSDSTINRKVAPYLKRKIIALASYNPSEMDILLGCDIRYDKKLYRVYIGGVPRVEEYPIEGYAPWTDEDQLEYDAMKIRMGKYPPTQTK